MNKSPVAPSATLWKAEQLSRPRQNTFKPLAPEKLKPRIHKGVTEVESLFAAVLVRRRVTTLDGGNSQPLSSAPPAANSPNSADEPEKSALDATPPELDAGRDAAAESADAVAVAEPPSPAAEAVRAASTPSPPPADVTDGGATATSLPPSEAPDKAVARPPEHTPAASAVVVVDAAADDDADDGDAAEEELSGSSDDEDADVDGAT